MVIEHLEISLRRVGLMAALSVLVACDVPPNTPKTMECHLDVEKRSGSTSDKFVGQFRMKNTTTRPLKIEYVSDPLGCLNIDVKDEKGQSLPESITANGALFAARTLRPQVLTLEPGEEYRDSVVLFAQVLDKRYLIKPGRYTVEAVYKWKTANGLEESFKSKKVMIEVMPK